MSALERVLHSVLFEALAVLFSIGGLMLFTSFHASELAGSLVIISIIAMLWNMVFNVIFDRLFTGEKQHRGWGVRIFHAVSFELGLVVITTPILAHMLHTTIVQAFMMDIGVTVFIMMYTVLFNFIYDTLRHRLVKRNKWVFA